MGGRFRPSRRGVLGGGVGAALACTAPRARGATGRAVMVGSANALAGMRDHYASLQEGLDPLSAAIEVVKVVEADPEDTSVGLGGLPNEDGVVQLDAACMDGATHNAGGVAALENILHPSEVARLVMERTDHVLMVGPGAYAFARAHGHPHVELLTDSSRRRWLEWRERMSADDDRLPPPGDGAGAGGGGALAGGAWTRPTGTVHCSALAPAGQVACTTTTSGLAFKIPGRVGDSPLIGAGLYCDQEAGSAGSTGRGEAAILAHGSSAIVELLRQGLDPLDAGLEVLRRVARQAERAARWQPALLDASGRPSFGVHFYVLALDGRTAGVTLRGDARYALADPEQGPRLEDLVPLFE